MDLELLPPSTSLSTLPRDHRANAGIFLGMPGFVVDFMSKETLHQTR